MKYADNFVCPKCGHNKGMLVDCTDGVLLMCENDNCTYSKSVESWEAPLRCPKCGSTHVSTGARGISGFWGAIGASKTVNRCGNCGHMWEPRG